MHKQTDKERVEDLKRDFEHLRAERAKREGDWKEVQKFVAPSAYSWENPHDRNPKRPRRYTSRPTNFLKTLKSGICGYSVSPNIAWLKLGFEDSRHAEGYGARDWLEAVEKTMYAEFNRSNLYPQVSKLIENAACYGHSAMLIDEQLADNRIRFSAISTPEAYLDTNEYGEVDTVFRRYAMTLKNAAAFFGESNLNDARRQEYTDKRNWNNEFVTLHAVHKRQGYDPDSKAAWDMPYASVYVDEGQDHILLESGYGEFPFAVFAWDPVTGTPYGESPAIHALDDIRMLNIIDETRIKIAQLAAEPPLNVPDSMREGLNVVPAGYNYYTKPDEIIKPIQTGASYPISLEIHQQIEKRVKDWFHVDFFLALMQERPANMTATYVMELQGEKASVLSDLIVNLNAALSAIVKRSFNILWRQRKLPMPPESLAGSGAELKVDFMGPLAQAQKKYHESAGIGQGIALIGSVAALSPGSLDVVDFDRALKDGLAGLGFPQAAIREDADVEAARAERAARQARASQQAMAMEQQKSLLGNYRQLNEPVKPGSAVEEMAKQAAGGLFP